MGYVEIDRSRCKGCQLCVSVCPRQLITLAAGMNQLGYHPAQFARTPAPEGECTGCAICGLVCPETAILVYR